jgi:hypothetical protein
MGTEPHHPRRVGMPAIDLIIAICVVLISVASLWIAVRSSDVQQRTLAASVWPYLDVGTSDVTSNDTEIIMYTIDNKGVGPGLLKWFVMSYHGKEYGDPREMLKACCGFSGNAITSRIHDRVIAARESIDFIRVLPKYMTAAQYHRLDIAERSIESHACYCDVLDDCWIFGAHEQPTPIASCPPSPVKRDLF